MAVSTAFLTFVLEQLNGVRHVTHKRMFGGVGLYSDDTFFGIIDNDTLFLKVDDRTRPRYEAAGMPPFTPIPDKPPMRGYHQVPPDILEDADALAEWTRDACAVPPTRKKARR